MDVSNQNFLVVGVSKSGCAVVEAIINSGGKCKFIEQGQTERIVDTINKLITKGAERVETEDYEQALKGVDVLVLSPGIPINHPIAVLAKQKAIRIIGELEFGFNAFLPKMVAVTGTNGKTTTVNLINAIIEESGRKSLLVGNVGVPLTTKIQENSSNAVYVVEVSSFQLETASAFCPHISCVLNISPDHLERHYTFENYVYLKKRIFKMQKESEYCLLNYDDKIVREFASEVKCKIKWVSIKEKVDGAYLHNGKLYFMDECVMDEKQLKLKGEHNVYDALFAIASTKILGVENQKIESALTNFKGIKHRLEFVGTKNGVDFYNDSKATNTASTISAINFMDKPTILILGGSEKGEDYTSLFEKIKMSLVKHVVLTGASRYNMLEQASKVGLSEISITSKFDFAVKIASMMSNSGENVLLSPACASFDAFNSYAERGDEFVKIVGEL